MLLFAATPRRPEAINIIITILIALSTFRDIWIYYVVCTLLWGVSWPPLRFTATFAFIEMMQSGDADRWTFRHLLVRLELQTGLTNETAVA